MATIKPAEIEKPLDTDVASVQHLVPIIAICCCFASLYCKFPECIGCTVAQTCCCCEQKGISCKPATNDKRMCCICSDCSINCIYPTTCMKGQQQQCCFDGRFALPCDADVPCVINLCGITLCYKYGCKIAICANFKTLG